MGVLTILCTSVITYYIIPPCKRWLSWQPVVITKIYDKTAKTSFKRGFRHAKHSWKMGQLRVSEGITLYRGVVGVSAEGMRRGAATVYVHTKLWQRAASSGNWQTTCLCTSRENCLFSFMYFNTTLLLKYDVYPIQFYRTWVARWITFMPPFKNLC